MSTANKVLKDPGASTLGNAIGELVNTFNNLRMSILGKYQIGEVDVEIVRYLDQQDMKKMKEVGEFFNIKLSTLTSTIDKLEKAKLVKRRNSKDDRRVIFIRPTAKGQNMLIELDQLTHEVSSKVAKNANKSEFAGLVSGIEKITKYIKAKA